MINFTFQKEVSDIPMILPVEMFIVEEETAAPEFQEEVNEIIPTLQEEVIEEEIEFEKAPETTEPVVEETLPEVSEPEPPVKEIVSEIVEINTMFNTGTVVGVSANVYGAGFPRNFIASFTWGGPQGTMEYRIDKALDTADRMMKRRGLEVNEVEKAILEQVYALSAEYRR